MEMFSILCYGDSNTWGYDPATLGRHSQVVRWTGVLRNSLNSKAYVIEEGLNGRTTVFDEPFREGRNGSKLLIPILESHAPLDLVIVALGANDLKPIYHASPYDSALGLKKIITLIYQNNFGRNSVSPEIIVITPVIFQELSSATSERFQGGREKFPQLIDEYKKVAEDCNAHFFDSNHICTASRIDGVHLDEQNHTKLGLALAEYISTKYDFFMTRQVKKELVEY